MIVKQIAVSYGRTINLGNFNSARLECTMTADLEDAENTNEAALELWEQARDQVKGQCERLLEAANQQ